jgi:hypothetical protein
VALKTAQIGKAGEVLVQYRLLLMGIESAPMTTDNGVDLVAYAPGRKEALTIQVKTNLRAKPGGGKGKALLNWWIGEAVPAQLIALVDLSSESVWLLRREEFFDLAQQKSSGRAQLYLYEDLTAKSKKVGSISYLYEFERFKIANRAHELFGV